jgi:P-type E1-E2 ATPase
VQNIFFDKTGTLTEDSFGIETFTYDEDFNKKEILSLAYQMESISSHPVAKAIRKQVLKELRSTPFIKPMTTLEIAGVGVRAKWNSDKYEIRRNSEISDKNTVSFYKNKQCIASWTFTNQIKNQSYFLIDKLKEKYKVNILSGDHKKEVNRVAKLLKINGTAYSEQKPEDKEKIIKKTNNTLMIGDGVNDTLALKNADVAIATQGSIELAFRSSHFYLRSSDIEVIPSILELAKKLKQNIKTNYLFSILFNIAGISLAFAGYITPLAAAILMPISSIALSLKSFYTIRLPQSNKGVAWKS